VINILLLASYFFGCFGACAPLAVKAKPSWVHSGTSSPLIPRNIGPIAENIVVVDDHVTQGDANAKYEAMFIGNVHVSLRFYRPWLA
jgi:hypothetical protein